MLCVRRPTRGAPVGNLAWAHLDVLDARAAGEAVAQRYAPGADGIRASCGGVHVRRRHRRQREALGVPSPPRPDRARRAARLRQQPHGRRVSSRQPRPRQPREPCNPGRVHVSNVTCRLPQSMRALRRCVTSSGVYEWCTTVPLPSSNRSESSHRLSTLGSVTVKQHGFVCPTDCTAPSTLSAVCIVRYCATHALPCTSSNESLSHASCEREPQTNSQRISSHTRQHWSLV